MDELIEQLRSSCSCLGQFDDQKAIDLVEDLLHTLSQMTCWSDDNCQTLLKGERQEILPIHVGDPCCCDAYYNEYTLKYDMIDESSIVLQLKVDEGIHTSLIAVPDEYWAYDYIENLLKVDLEGLLEDDRCKCGPSTKLLINYEAGYDPANLPECIIKPLCVMLKALVASSTGCGPLEECANLSEKALDARLQSYSIEDISWRWVIDKTSIDHMFLQIIKKTYMRRLATISQCDRSIYGDQILFEIGGSGKYDRCDVRRTTL